MLQAYVCLKTHFFIEVSDGSEKLQFELIELYYDSILHCSIDLEPLIAFCASLPVSWFSGLYTLAQNLLSVFGST